MGVRLVLRDGTLTALLNGEIDHHTARQLREEIDETAMKTKPEKIRLDFSEVQFMDSSGIGLIMGRCKLIQLWGGSVTVANLPSKLEKIVSLSGLKELCTIERGGTENENRE